MNFLSLRILREINFGFLWIETIRKCQNFKFDKKKKLKQKITRDKHSHFGNQQYLFSFFFKIDSSFPRNFCYVVKTPTYFIYHQFNKIINNPSTKSPPYKKLGRPLRFWECANVSTEFDFTQNLKKLETFNIVIEIGSKIIKFQHYVF